MKPVVISLMLRMRIILKQRRKARALLNMLLKLFAALRKNSDRGRLRAPVDVGGDGV